MSFPINVCLKSYYELHNDIYPVKVMKVTFSGEARLPVLSSGMALGWMPSFPGWMTAKI